jgi:hypothetical protein
MVLGAIWCPLEKTRDIARSLRTIDFSNPSERARHDRMVQLVDTMLKLHKDLQAAKTNHEKSLIHRQFDATDRQIDQLVYELYGLTEKEIRIVEETLLIRYE